MKKPMVSGYPAWKPSKPPSRGAVAYHSAVIRASWHRDNIREMIRLVKRSIGDNHIVVDFGAGTGSSATLILRDMPRTCSLYLVDNSQSWLGHAYQLLHVNPNVTCLLLEKGEERYQTLDELMGSSAVHHVLSANTVHLIPNVDQVFIGIYRALKAHGTFTFQSGNIKRQKREKGILMIDDSIDRVHDAALTIIKTDKQYARYRKDLNERIKETRLQRKFVFPDPRPVDFYVRQLNDIGFRNVQTVQKKITVHYKDWLDFLRVRRLQAGILPEIGGKEPTPKQEQDRDAIITSACRLMFKHLSEHNTLANHTSFTTEWIYFRAVK